MGHWDSGSRPMQHCGHVHEYVEIKQKASHWAPPYYSFPDTTGEAYLSSVQQSLKAQTQTKSRQFTAVPHGWGGASQQGTDMVLISDRAPPRREQPGLSRMQPLSLTFLVLAILLVPINMAHLFGFFLTHGGRFCFPLLALCSPLPLSKDPRPIWKSFPTSYDTSPFSCLLILTKCHFPIR